MPTIRELVEEAEENYSTGRYGNSSQLFKRAALETLDRQVIADPFYLAYRSLRDFEDIGQHKELVTFMMTFVQNTLKQIARVCSKIIEEGNEDILSVLKIQIQALKQLSKEEEVEPVIEILLKELYSEYLKDKNISFLEEAYHFQPSSKTRLDLLMAISDIFNTNSSKLLDSTQYRDIQFVIEHAMYLQFLSDQDVNDVTVSQFKSIQDISDAFDECRRTEEDQKNFIISVISSFYSGNFCEEDYTTEIVEMIDSQFQRYHLDHILEVVRRN